MDSVLEICTNYVISHTYETYMIHMIPLYLMKSQAALITLYFFQI